MAITLQEAKVGMRDHVDQNVIDEFRRSSLLLDKLTFDNSISPGTGGSTLTYGYIQLQTPSTAAVRTINSEYAAGEAKRKEKTAKAITFGGSFKLDRVLQDTSGAIDELQFQLQQKIKATTNYFHNLVINGIAAGSGSGQQVANTFDGLSKILASTETEITSQIDISTSELLDANANAFLDELDGFIATLDGKPDMLLMNDKMLLKLRSIARRAGYYTRSENSFGDFIEEYNGIALVDAGKYYNGSATKDVIETTAAGPGTEGKTDIYAVKFGLDAFHGISPIGNKIVKTYLPDMAAPGAVKTGEVEMIAGVVLKNTKKAGVLRGIKIVPATGE